jgi:pyridoxine 5'-phosphate synthase PdxJ
MIHTKSGKTYTDKDCYPWTIPAGEEITSVERTIAGKVVAVKATKEVHNIYVKATESKDLSILIDPDAEQLESASVVEALSIGFHVGEAPNVFRIELDCDPRNGNVMCVAKKVDKATQDGF